MAKKTINKDVRRSITGSLGRFLSIFSLMVLGVFAFVGLKVSGPNMRATAEHFYTQHRLADLTVTSTLGLDDSDQKLIKATSGVKQVEFGYFRDVLLKGTHTSLRLFSPPQDLSTYALQAGRMPTQKGEIALDYLYEGQFRLGDTIDFTEEKSDGNYILRQHSFKIVGFIKSSEYVDKNDFGRTTIGTGQLNGYGVVSKNTFDSSVYMIARMTFTQMQGLSIYDVRYNDLASHYQTKVENQLKNQPENRLKALKTEPQQQIDSAKVELEQKEQQITQQKSQLDTQQQQLAAAEATGLPVSSEMQAEIDDGQQQIKQAQAKITSAQSDLQIKQEALNRLVAPVYTVNNRKDGNPGYQSFLDDSTRIDTLSNVFPVVLFAIALLVSLTTMTRFVEEERSNLGLLKALGYSNRQIHQKFIVYGLVSSGSGAVVGTILGHTFLPIAVFNAYTASSTFSNLRLTFSVFWTIVAFLIAIACSVLPAYWVVYQELRAAPAQLFLAKAPKAGSRILLEKIGFIWRRMSFTYKVTARNLFRYKKRMLMTIFGVAGCTALLVMGFGIRDSISGLASRQFGDILHYDMIAVEQEKMSNSEHDELDKKLNSDTITSHLSVHFEQLTKKTDDNETQQISMIVPNHTNHFSQYVTLRNRISQKKLLLTDSGAIISEKLSDLLNVKVGDYFTVENADHKQFKIRISGITEMYMGHYLFMSPIEYQHVFGKNFAANAQLIKLTDSKESNVREQSAKLMSLPAVAAISQNIDMRNTIDAFMQGMNSVMFVLIICAILLAVVVIYNLTNINVSERIRELSTIKVLGFYDREVTMYIYRETILLSFIGIFCGFGLGAFFHRFIIEQVAPDLVMFNPSLLWTNLLLSATITMATTLALSLFVHFKLKRVDMLGALKSID